MRRERVGGPPARGAGRCAHPPPGRQCLFGGTRPEGLSDGLQELATQIATRVTKEGKQKIAVLPFRELDGRATVLSTYISEELVTNLFVIGGLEIVERSLLDRLLGELKLGRTGLVDPETARQVGKVAGVDAIVTGTITDLQSYVALNCRLIDAETGRIFAAAQTKIVKDDDVRKIMGVELPLPAGESSGSSPPAGSSAATGGPGAVSAIQQQQADGFVFDLKGCQLSGTSVVCDFLVTNTGEDRYLYAGVENSRLFDDHGNEYHATAVSIGSDVGSTSGWTGRTAGTLVISGVPVRAVLVFEGVPLKTKRATLLEFVTDSGSRVQFRDVPLGGS